MKVGTDLDGVVTTFSGFISSKIKWPWWLLFFLSFERPQKKIVSLFKKWKEEGNDITIISARPKRLENLTRKWLRKHNIPFDEIFFIEPGKNVEERKLKVINQLGIGVFIDDTKEIISFLKKNNIQAKSPKEAI